MRHRYPPKNIAVSTFAAPDPDSIKKSHRFVKTIMPPKGRAPSSDIAKTALKTPRQEPCFRRGFETKLAKFYFVKTLI